MSQVVRDSEMRCCEQGGGAEPQILGIFCYIIYSYFILMQAQTTSSSSYSQGKPCRSLLLISRKKFKNIRQCHSKRGNQKLGMWNLTETIRYISFVKQSLDKFETEESRRESRVFCLMARQVRTRNSVQCRSHHQKMVQTYGHLTNIIAHYEENVIPYYTAKAHTLEPRSSELVQPEPFFVFKQVGSVLRLEIREEFIASY